MCGESWQTVDAQWCPLPLEAQLFPAGNKAGLSHQGRRKRLIPEETHRRDGTCHLLLSHFTEYFLFFMLRRVLLYMYKQMAPLPGVSLHQQSWSAVGT